jgi:hypothetical protein
MKRYLFFFLLLLPLRLLCQEQPYPIVTIANTYTATAFKAYIFVLTTKPQDSISITKIWIGKRRFVAIDDSEYIGPTQAELRVAVYNEAAARRDSSYRQFIRKPINQHLPPSYKGTALIEYLWRGRRYYMPIKQFAENSWPVASHGEAPPCNALPQVCGFQIELR